MHGQHGIVFTLMLYAKTISYFKKILIGYMNIRCDKHYYNIYYYHFSPIEVILFKYHMPSPHSVRPLPIGRRLFREKLLSPISLHYLQSGEIKLQYHFLQQFFRKKCLQSLRINYYQCPGKLIFIIIQGKTLSIIYPGGSFF